MVFIQDVYDLPSSVSITDEGYMTATAKVARSGIQVYRGYELGKKGDNNEYKVFRPSQEVKDSVATIPHKPITIDHRGMVNIKNNSALSRGFISDAVYEDGWVSVKLCINHPEGIQAVYNGYKKHSLGYNSDLKWEPGTVPSDEPFNAGESYDVLMQKIKVNHDALVKAARAGELATFDSEQNADINIDASKNVISIKQESKGATISMTKKYQVTLLDNATIELEGDNAQDIYGLVQKLQGDNEIFKTKVQDSDTALVDAKAEIIKLTAERDALKGKVDVLQPIADSAPKVEKIVAERAEWISVFDSVRSLIKEPTYQESVKDLKVIAIKSINDSLDLSDKSDDYINAVFDVYRPQLGKSDASKRLTAKDILDQSTSNSFEDSVKSAETEYLQSLENAWKA